MARSLNRVQLIGNLTRDPELRYTPSGTAVATFGIATNRSWTTDTGEKKEEVEFHKIVAWNKLGELCSQLLSKGRKVYVEGRLAYRKYTNKDGIEKDTTEIVIDDMMILDPKRDGASTYVPAEGPNVPKEPEESKVEPAVTKEKKETKTPEAADASASSAQDQGMSAEDIADDIPF
jgi:single-strand DNA-binding protein